MLLLSDKLKNVPIMSLQTGGELARTIEPIIDPRSLFIPAFYVDGPLVDIKPSVLHTDDIREAGSLGFIIDGSEKLMELDGLVRLQQIIDFHFDIFACTVYDVSGKKLGKVSDYSFEPDGYTIQQIYIQQSWLRSITATSNIIHRKQIVSVSPGRIVVDSPTIHESLTEKAGEAAAFVNPFRSQSPQPDQSRPH